MQGNRWEEFQLSFIRDWGRTHKQNEMISLECLNVSSSL